MRSYIGVPVVFSSTEEERNLVKRGEYEFNHRFAELAAKIDEECDTFDMVFLTLCGPTCSGKTTAAEYLTAALTETGRCVHLISLDDFYFDRSVLHERAERAGKPLDYDSVDTLDLACLSACVSELVRNGRTELPLFDFHSGTRASYRPLAADPDHKNVYIFEGIQALYPEVSAILKEEGTSDSQSRKYLSLFISVQRGIQVGDQCFSPDEIRLMRRLVRDSVRRSAKTAFTLSLWESVRKNEIQSVLPHEASCDFTVDSTMPYDVHMLSPYLLPLLETVSKDDETYETAQDLKTRLQGIASASPSFLEPNSLYREFL